LHTIKREKKKGKAKAPTNEKHEERTSTFLLQIRGGEEWKKGHTAKETTEKKKTR